MHFRRRSDVCLSLQKEDKINSMRRKDASVRLDSSFDKVFALNH